MGETYPLLQFTSLLSQSKSGTPFHQKSEKGFLFARKQHKSCSKFTVKILLLIQFIFIHTIFYNND